MVEVAQWRLAGDWFDVCRCRVPCACTFAQAPDEGECDGTYSIPSTSSISSAKPAGQPPASPPKIVCSASRWEPSARSSTKNPILGFASPAQIEFELADDLSRWSVEVPGKAKGSAEALTGPTSPETPVTVHNAPGAEIGPGQVATYATASEDDVGAFGFKWSWPGRSSKHSRSIGPGPTRAETSKGGQACPPLGRSKATGSRTATATRVAPATSIRPPRTGSARA